MTLPKYPKQHYIGSNEFAFSQIHSYNISGVLFILKLLLKTFLTNNKNNNQKQKYSLKKKLISNDLAKRWGPAFPR